MNSTAFNSNVGRVLHIRGGMVMKNKPMRMGRSIYEEKPIQEPIPMSKMSGAGSLQKIEGHAPVPKQRDLTELNAILSGVQVGAGIMKKKRKIRL